MTGRLPCAPVPITRRRHFVCPKSLRNFLDAFFLRLEIFPPSITTSCSQVTPSRSGSSRKKSLRTARPPPIYWQKNTPNRERHQLVKTGAAVGSCQHGAGHQRRFGCALIGLLLGPPLLGLEFGDVALLYVLGDEEVSVKAAVQAQRQRRLGVEEHPAPGLAAGHVVNIYGVTTHAASVAERSFECGCRRL